MQKVKKSNDPVSVTCLDDRVVWLPSGFVFGPPDGPFKIVKVPGWYVLPLQGVDLAGPLADAGLAKAFLVESSEREARERLANAGLRDVSVWVARNSSGEGRLFGSKPRVKTRPNKAGVWYVSALQDDCDEDEEPDDDLDISVCPLWLAKFCLEPGECREFKLSMLPVL